LSHAVGARDSSGNWPDLVTRGGADPNRTEETGKREHRGSDQDRQAIRGEQSASDGDPQDDSDPIDPG
jgi:hypothetical protein